MRWRIMVSSLSLAIICFGVGYASGVRDFAIQIICMPCIKKRTTNSSMVSCATLK